MFMLTANESILRAARKSDELLEPYEWKRSCTVLRRERAGNRPDLADYIHQARKKGLGYLTEMTVDTRHGIITGVNCYPANQRESDSILEHLKGQPCKYQEIGLDGG
jgi:hypothetical protein